MAMIELVFAIVIMGIAVMSLPLILTQVQNSNSFALRQEVILSIKTKLSYILAYQWDQNTYDATADIERVLNIPASADTATDFNTSNIRRKGHVLADGRRRLWDNNLTIVATAKANFRTDTLNDDIDDFNGKDENKTITALDDFIFNVELNTTVDYMQDTLPVGNSYANTAITFTFDPINNTTNNSTNIKMIRVSATADGIENPISMFAFSSNIGQSKVAKKRW